MVRNRSKIMTVDRLSQAARRQQRSLASASGAAGDNRAKTSGGAASPLPTPSSPSRRYGAWRPSAAYWPERIRVR
jgi:hypothetical protein